MSTVEEQELILNEPQEDVVVEEITTEEISANEGMASHQDNEGEDSNNLNGAAIDEEDQQLNAGDEAAATDVVVPSFPTLRIHIGNLDRTTTRDDLLTLFDKYKPDLTEVWVARQPSGFAFVTINESVFEEFVSTFNGVMVGGRPLKMEEAKTSGRRDVPRRLETQQRRGGHPNSNHNSNIRNSGGFGPGRGVVRGLAQRRPREDSRERFQTDRRREERRDDRRDDRREERRDDRREERRDGRRDERRDERRDGRDDERRDGRREERRDDRRDERRDGRRDERRDDRREERRDGRREERRDDRRDDRRDGRRDERRDDERRDRRDGREDRDERRDDRRDDRREKQHRPERRDDRRPRQ